MILRILRTLPYICTSSCLENHIFLKQIFSWLQVRWQIFLLYDKLPIWTWNGWSALNILRNGRVVFIVRTQELIFSFFSPLSSWVFGQHFFQVLILRIYPFPFHVKISSHRCNSPQRNLRLWILIRNPQSHFSSGRGVPGWGGSAHRPLFMYAYEPSVLGAKRAPLPGCVL